VFIFVSTLLMIVYFWRLIEIIYVRATPGRSQSELRIEEAPLSMLIPNLIFGALTFAVGIVWMTGLITPLLDAVNASFGLGVP
jgi:NADH:ubiquinone oxidoreductase subunit 5 (subunit L)/multisubunit Na+/H+ antiporter MnhA subunit